MKNLHFCGVHFPVQGIHRWWHIIFPTLFSNPSLFTSIVPKSIWNHHFSNASSSLLWGDVIYGWPLITKRYWPKTIHSVTAGSSSLHSYRIEANSFRRKHAPTMYTSTQQPQPLQPPQKNQMVRFHKFLSVEKPNYHVGGKISPKTFQPILGLFCW